MRKAAKGILSPATLAQPRCPASIILQNQAQLPRYYITGSSIISASSYIATISSKRRGTDVDLPIYLYQRAPLPATTNGDHYCHLQSTRVMAESIYSSIPLSTASKEIRLLSISPSSDRSSKICCSLHKASLNDNAAYKALSYVWGSNTDQQVIELDGHDFEVTRNLHDALIRIRDGIEARVFWIDAVCIDQTSPAEKADQVPLMGDIYRLAEEVWCWLGLAQDGDDEVIAGVDFARLPGTSERVEEARVAIYDFIRECLSHRGIEALIHMCEAPYWSRTWIIQEISLAREIRVMWGEYRLSSDILRFVSVIIATIMTAPRWGVPNFEVLLTDMLTATVSAMNVNTARLWVREGFERGKPLEFLANQSRLQVSDPRDKIYGFLGLLGDKLPFPVIDYTQNVEKIFTDFAQWQVEESRSLEVIRFTGFERSPNKNLHLPSWVPDWDGSWMTVNDASIKPIHSSLCSSTKGRPSSASFKGNTLFVDGIECDRVSLICKEMIPLGAEDLLFRDKPFTYPTGISRLQALFRVLIMDKYYFSDYRLGDDPGLWELRLVIGFFVYLGWSAGEKVDKDDQSVCDKDEIEDMLESPPHVERDSNGYTRVVVDTELEIDVRKHLFIRALRNWYHGCIRVIDNILEGSGGRKVDQDGCIQNKTMFIRILEIKLLSLGGQYQDSAEGGNSVQLTNLEYSPESLRCWKDCIETALRGETFDTILEPFLHHEAEAQPIQWPEHVPPGHEFIYFSRFELSMYTWTESTTSLFETKDGYFGLGPKTMRKDDLICVLFGSNVPFVLRRVGDYFVLVGECFVLGLMDGEAIDRLERGQGNVQTFEIR
jgi:hypothetical protein